MSTNHVSLIIVNYNSSGLTRKLLYSLKNNKEINEITIIDNGSNLENVKQINAITKSSKYIKLIKNSINVGFSKAVNQGIISSNNEYILLLNPDTRFNTKTDIGKLVKTLSRKKISVVGGRIRILGKNLYQKSATFKPDFLTAIFEFTIFKKIFPKNKYTLKFWAENNIKTIKKEIEVSSLCGAFILFKKNINGALNLFDENYFLYMEDLDFGLSQHKKGYKVFFIPSVEIEHIGGASSNSVYNIELKHWYNSRIYFFKKNLGLFKGLILNVIFIVEEILLSIYHKLNHEPSY